MAYPHERQIEYWTSRAIEDYFDNEGYTVVVLPNSQRIEKVLPYDHLFAGNGIKVFGLQYKRLHKGSPDYWRIDFSQYKQIAKFDWIYYALPQVKSIRQRRNSLHLLTIVTANALKSKAASFTGSQYMSLSTSELGFDANKVRYSRWGGFVQQLFACTMGWRPSTADELRTVFSDAGDLLQSMTDLYIVPLKPSVAFRITPFETNIENLEEGFDFGLEQEG